MKWGEGVKVVPKVAQSPYPKYQNSKYWLFHKRGVRYRNCCFNDMQFDIIEYFAKTKQLQQLRKRGRKFQRYFLN